MVKRIVRCACIFLVLGLVMVLPVHANTEENQRASSYFVSYSVYIEKTGSNSYQACYIVTSTDTMLEIGATSLEIQESDDGTDWSTVRTYTSKYYPQMIAENAGIHTWEFGRGATSGKCYRIKVTLWAKNSRGSGERTVYSDPVWF